MKALFLPTLFLPTILLPTIYLPTVFAEELRTEKKDLDQDGREETTLTFDGKRPMRLERDRNGDGKPDVWGVYSYPSETERRADLMVDRNHDGTPDYWRLDVNSVPTKEWGDLNYDGKVDSWAFYASLMRKEWVVLDKNFDGTPDAWFHYGTDPMKADAGEIDEDFDGKADRIFGALPEKRPTIDGVTPPPMSHDAGIADRR